MKNSLQFNVIYLFCFAAFQCMNVYCINTVKLEASNKNFSITNGTSKPIGVIIIDADLAKKNKHQGFYLKPQSYKKESIGVFTINTKSPVFVAIWSQEQLPKEKIVVNFSKDKLAPIFQPGGYKLFKISPQFGQLVHLKWNGKKQGNHLLIPTKTGIIDYFKHNNSIENNINQNQIQQIITLDAQ